MATNYAQKLERERQSPKGNLTTDTGWMKIKKAVGNRLKGTGISQSDAQQKAKNIKNSLEIQRKQFELKRRYK